MMNQMQQQYHQMMQHMVQQQQQNQQQQNQQHNGPPQSKLPEFLDVRPPTFSSTTNPMEANDWLYAIEKRLNLLQCTDQEKPEQRLLGMSFVVFSGKPRFPMELLHRRSRISQEISAKAIVETRTTVIPFRARQWHSLKLRSPNSQRRSQDESPSHVSIVENPDILQISVLSQSAMDPRLFKLVLITCLWKKLKQRQKWFWSPLTQKKGVSLNHVESEQQDKVMKDVPNLEDIPVVYKFEARSTDGMFLGYPAHSRGYRVLVLETNKIIETCEVTFDEASPGTRPETAGTLSQVQGEDGRIFEDESDDEVGLAGQTGRQADQTTDTPPVRSAQDVWLDRPGSSGYDYVHADRDGPPEATTSTSEELENFERNKVWTLVEPPSRHNIIGTKKVFKNKPDEDGLIVRNKARLVAQGFTQVEGLDFNETFAPVDRIEAIRHLLACTASKGFKLYQMDVKSAFLNGFIQEKVYVKQPPGFENPDFCNHILKLSKALSDLKQAPRAWYDRLKNFLLVKGFQMGKIYKALFVLKHADNQLFVQIYVDDIIFGC
uniref:OSJNBa0033H08.15 protein n=1 Tax=Oryza sativa subsp. japonica TaxID=39947 RepID=Q7XXL7_ORYSJ|nr:OSJNBa0033H08.15 [Oryza sativa Japonica Group]